MAHYQYLLCSFANFGLVECYLQLVPMIEGVCLTIDMASMPMEPPYCHLVVGKLRHISTMQLDIVYVVAIVNRYT
jgi:hypothetical protein